MVSNVKDVYVVLYPNFTALDVFGPVEVLGSIKEYTIRYVSLHGGIIHNRQGIQIITEPMDVIEPGGIILIPGGYGSREIIKDAAMYPINNVKALVIYVALMIVAVLELIFTGVGFIGASEASGAAAGGLGILGIIGIIIALAIVILIAGYMLDVIKIAVNREDGAPEIDPQRQIINGLKLIVLAFIYMIIPIIVMVLLSAINEYLAIIGIILLIVFAVLLVIAQCRLAKTESLGEALNFGEVINDLKEINVIYFSNVSNKCIFYNIFYIFSLSFYIFFN